MKDKKEYMFRRLINVKKSLYFLFVKKAKELGISKKALINAFIRFGLDNIDIIKEKYITKDLLEKKNYCIRVSFKIRKEFNNDLTEYCKKNNITKTDLINRVIDIILENKDILIKKQKNKQYVYFEGKKNIKENVGITFSIEKDKYKKFKKEVKEKTGSSFLIPAIIRNNLYDYIKGNL